MRPVALSDEIAVGEMPSADEIIVLAKAGFRSLLNVQPDGEVDRLPTTAQTEAGVQAAGMKYAYVPVVSRRVSDATVAAFADAMMTLPRPIYACCYSGARAAAAWALAVAPTMAPGDIVSTCSAAGFDMSSLVPDFERRYGKTAAASSAPALAEGQIAVTPDLAAPAAATEPVTGDAGVEGQAPSPTAAAMTSPTAAGGDDTPVAAAPSAPDAVNATTKIIFPRAAGAGGFAVSG